MAASNLSALPSKYDFASELVLNRIMNGQVETNGGKTINTATRNMATRHDATALSCDVLAANVAADKTIVETTQDALTEIIYQIEKVREASLAVDVDIDAFGHALQDNFDSLLATEVQGVKVFQGRGETATIGNPAVNLFETLDVGDLDLRSTSTSPKFADFYTGIASGGSLITQAGSRDQVAQLCDDAIQELKGYIVRKGAQINILNNRYDMYNDLAATYHDASDGEAMNMGGSTGILNAAL